MGRIRPEARLSWVSRLRGGLLAETWLGRCPEVEFSSGPSSLHHPSLAPVTGSLSAAWGGDRSPVLPTVIQDNSAVPQIPCSLFEENALNSPEREKKKPRKTYGLFLPPLLLYLSPEATAACPDEKGKGGSGSRRNNRKHEVVYQDRMPLCIQKQTGGRG